MSELRPYPAYKDSGVEWIGDVPKKWKQLKLKRLLKVRNGREIIDENVPESKSVNVYGSGGIFKKTNYFLYDGKSVLFGRKGTIGEPLFVNEKFWTVDTMYFTEIYDNAIPKYIYYLLSIYPWNLIATKTALPSVVGTDVLNTVVSVPPKSEQLIIRTYLDHKTSQIDSLIADKERLIELLEEKRQAVITETVTKGLNPHVKKKDSGIEWIGEIPEHWEVNSFKRYMKVKNGREILDDNESKNGKAYNVYGSGGIFKKSNHYLHDGESVLFGRKGTIGKPMFVDDRFWTVDTMYYTEIKNDTAPKYIYYVLGIYPWDSIVTKTALPSIVGTEVENSKVSLPRLEEQKEIVQYLDEKSNGIEKLKKDIKFQVGKLKQYRESLIYEAVTGKIDVRDYQNRGEFVESNYE